MALSILSSVNNNITKYSGASTALPQPYIWLKFANGDTYTASALTNYGSGSGFTYSNTIASKSITNNVLQCTTSNVSTNAILINNVAYPTSSGFSLSYWVYIKGTNSTQSNYLGIVQLYNGGFGFSQAGSGVPTNGDNFNFWTSPSGAWVVGNYQDGSYSKMDSTNIKGSNGLYHLVYVWNSSNNTYTMYQNNVVVASGTYTYGAATSRTNSVSSQNISNSGGSTNASTLYSVTNMYVGIGGFYGYMADVRLFSGVVLNSTQVNSLYTSPTFNTTLTV